ncbi:MAG: 30S ribosomal protein S14 [Legionellales bacterium]|nr:30S ribosomal protein S14 [Legionellales bacterium]
MASNRMIRRETKRTRLQKKHAAKRASLREQLKDPSLSLDDKLEIQAQFRKLPRDSSKVRLAGRCQLTGRARGVYRMVGICRNMLRKLANQGEIPGITKSSW